MPCLSFVFGVFFNVLCATTLFLCNHLFLPQEESCRQDYGSGDAHAIAYRQGKCECYLAYHDERGADEGHEHGRYKHYNVQFLFQSKVNCYCP